MDLKEKSGKKVSNYINLLISLLVCYPQINSINYEPSNKKMNFTFLLNNVNKKDYNFLKKQLYSSIKIYYNLKGINNLKEPYLDFQYKDTFSVLKIYRDISILNEEEISIIIGVIVQVLSDYIVYDKDLKQEEIRENGFINTLLDHFRNKAIEEKITAYREEGRVMVLNK